MKYHYKTGRSTLMKILKHLKKMISMLLVVLIVSNFGMIVVASLAASQREVRVTNDTELQNALLKVLPGDVIIIADGNYKGFSIEGVKATETNPVHIKAENYGEAVFNTGSILIRDCENIILDSFKISFPGEAIKTPNGDNKDRIVGVFIDDSSNCRVTKCSFKMEIGANSIATECLFIFGNSDYNRVDYCEFGPFANPKGGHYVYPCSNQTIAGYDISAINQDRTAWAEGRGPYNPNVPRYTRIDHNYFYDMSKGETICLGGAGIAGDYQEMYNVVEYNLFENNTGDAEMIAIKGSKNAIRYNTVIECNGTISSRAGNNNEIYGNYILQGEKKGSAGIKIYEKGHKVYNNYIEGTVDLAFLFGNGNGYTDKFPTGHAKAGRLAFTHAQVVGAQVVNNTFVGVNEWQVRSGWTNNNSKATGIALTPIDSVFANNLIIGDAYSLLFEDGTPQTVLYANNIIDGQIKDIKSGAENDPGKFRVVPDAAMTRDSDGIARLWFTNPVIDAGNTQYSSFVTEDINGKPRKGTLDVGAEEFSSMKVKRNVLNWTDVGPFALIPGLSAPEIALRVQEPKIVQTPASSEEYIFVDDEYLVFDKNIQNQKDIPVKVMYESNILTEISNEGIMSDPANTGKLYRKRYAITEDDYFITDVVTDTIAGSLSSNVYNIKKEFLENMRVGEAIPFTFKFSDGKTAAFKVKIVDTSIPSIVAPANIKVETYSTFRKVNIHSAAAVSDVILTNDAPAVFPLGKTIVTWTATNRYGYTNTDTQEINVIQKLRRK